MNGAVMRHKKKICLQIMPPINQGGLDNTGNVTRDEKTCFAEDYFKNERSVIDFVV